MSFLKSKLKSKQALVHIFALTLFFSGIIFGSFYYFYGWDIIIDTFSELFFVSRENVTNDYNLYIVFTATYIVIALLLSTSFLGVVFNSFVVFTKGMQIAVATIHIFGIVEISAAEIFTCYLPQLLIELALIYVISIITIQLSINSFMVSFAVQDNYNSKKVINYILDYLIVIMIILTLSMLFRVYVI